MYRRMQEQRAELMTGNIKPDFELMTSNIKPDFEIWRSNGNPMNEPNNTKSGVVDSTEYCSWGSLHSGRCSRRTMTDLVPHQS